MTPELSRICICFATLAPSYNGDCCLDYFVKVQSRISLLGNRQRDRAYLAAVE